VLRYRRDGDVAADEVDLAVRLFGQRHAWDKETPGMFDALLAMEEAAKAGAAG